MLGRNRVSLALPYGVGLALMISAVTGRTFPQTQDLKGEVVTTKDLPIAGAVCTLKGRGLPAEGISVTTGERGDSSIRVWRPANTI